jgi:hypothetical protein
MQSIKHDINQVEHLIILLMFAGLVFTLSGHEDFFISLQNNIDNYIGWNDAIIMDNNNGVVDDTSIIRHEYFYNIVIRIKEWIIEDYKSSQCRKWINTTNNKVRNIFSL